MPIDTKHPLYIDREPQWKRCRDADGGEDTVKAAGVHYLPRLGTQTPEEYASYKGRGLYLEAMPRTITALSGAVFRKDPVIEHKDDEATRAFLEDVSGQREPLARFAQGLLDENLIIGRVGVWVDMDETPSANNRPRLIRVPGENIINWDLHSRWFVVQEKVREETADIFEHKEIDQWRYMYLDEQGHYWVDVWQKDTSTIETVQQKKFKLVSSIQPKRQGVPLDFIPLYILSGNQHGPTPHKPPLVGLADASYDHYRMVTDYRHGLHWTALPTPWFAGFDRSDTINVGSGTAIVADNANARAEMLEFDGQGLNPLKEAIEANMDYMASLGARILEQPKRFVEAAATHQMRANTEQTTVQSMASATSKTLTEAVQVALWWGNMEDKDFACVLNTDLVDAQVNVEVLKQLSADVMAGFISHETYYHNLEKAELTRPNIDIEDERALIGEIEDNAFDQAAGG